MSRYYYRTKSRLARTQSRKMMHQAVRFVVLAILLVFLLVRFGVPLLIKMAVFIGNLTGKRSDTTTQESSILVPPTLQPLPEATYSARLNISGYGQEDVMVALFVNGSEVDEIGVDSEGEFEFKNVRLKLGKNRIWAVTRDKQDNRSRESEEIEVIVDNDPPVITITNPKDNAQVSENTITVEGEVDEEAQILINDQFVVQRSDNSFAKTLNLNEGDNQLLIKAVDAAGNEAEKTVNVLYLK